MKLKAFLLALVACALCCSCGKDNSVGPEPVNPLSHDERPTDWNVDLSRRDPAFSMTMTVEVSLPDFPQFEVTQQDLMAAFMCGTCRCSQPPVKLGGGKALFFLNVVGMTTDDPDAEKAVTLRYYSEALHHIFTIQAEVYFQNGEILGSPSTPYKPVWKR